MRITRLDLDGAGSPSALVTRILNVEPDLPIPVPVGELCSQLDIVAIDDLRTRGFEAALITDAVKSQGAILVAKDRPRQRRRFSIGHELGHFLIPTHQVPEGQPLLCSAEQMLLLDTREQDRRRRMEVEANRFAALLLMPPPVLRRELGKALPDLAEILRLARLFDVSKEAMARSYAEYHREAVAVVVIRNSRVVRCYRQREFPWIEVGAGRNVPLGSLIHDGAHSPGTASPIEECEVDIWLDDRNAAKVEVMTEQVLIQRDGHALVLLHAGISDEDKDRDDLGNRCRPRI